MRIRPLLHTLTCTALALLAFPANHVHAGSFFGPCCYGADYTYRYPNRSHNIFGCGPGMHCRAWHPLCKHRLFRRRRAAANQGMPVNAMPSYGMAVNGVPVADMPVESVQTPVVQSPNATVPFHTTAIAPAPVPATPAVRSRIAPVPAPLPTGPVVAEPPLADQSGKPPF